MFDSPAFRRVLERLALATSHYPANDDVRMVVQARARDACEYCLIPTRVQFHVEHIVPVSHWHAYLDGTLLIQPSSEDREPNHLTNFAWSCSSCNASKGNRISGRVGRHTYPLFHPRRDRWEDHFLLTDGFLLIRGVTEIGQATERILAFNSSRPNGPISLRHRAILEGIYPPPWARGWGY